jgi:ATP-dependent DNA helicase PIF1
MMLLEEQIVQEINLSQDLAPTQLIIIQGKAGCGKSTLIKAMTAKLTETLTNESFILMAPTGAAALNIEGSTIHATLNIPIKQSQFQPLQGEARHEFLNFMAPVRFIIIDEYSMVGLSLLGMIEHRCAEANPHNKTQVIIYPSYFFS